MMSMNRLDDTVIGLQMKETEKKNETKMHNEEQWNKKACNSFENNVNNNVVYYDNSQNIQS